MSYSSRYGGGPPPWFIFILAVAFIFGAYYLFLGVRSYLHTGGLSVAQATEVSVAGVTATVQRREVLQSELPTRRPTTTPKPPCQEFEVRVESGILRREPSTSAAVVDALPQGTILCVLQSERGADGALWYLIDTEPVTRRIETAYVREDVIRALNPTATPTDTAPPPPTITLTRTASPTATHTPTPTLLPGTQPTTDPNITPTATPSATPSPTPPAVSI